MAYIPATLIAAHLRARLKAAFPGVRLSVRTSNGATINISWQDGPSTAEVQALTSGLTSRKGTWGEVVPAPELTVTTKQGPVTGRPCVEHLFLNRTYSDLVLAQAGEWWARAAGREVPDAREWVPALAVRGYRVPEGTVHAQLGAIADRMLAAALEIGA